MRAREAVDKTDNGTRRSRSMFGGALLLAVCSIVAKVFGALYRIPLTNILGAEGIGVYQLAFPIYALLLTAATGGIPVAVSRLVAEKRAVGESARGVLTAAFLTVLALAVLGSVALVFLAPYVAAGQGNASVAMVYPALAPALLFACGVAFLRGWAQGRLDTIPSSVAVLTEQAAKLAFGLWLATRLVDRGAIYGVMGAVYGIAISEAIAFFVTALLVALRGKKCLISVPKLPREKLKKTHFKQVGKIALIISIGVLLIPFSQFIDSFLIINLLKGSGYATARATAMYGLYSAPVASLVNLPVVLTISLAVLIVPAVSSARVERDLDSVLKKSSLSLKIAYVVGVPCAIVMFVFARDILSLLYSSLVGEELTIATLLLRVSAFEILFMSGTQIYTALLQAFDRSAVPVVNLAVAIAVKTVLTVLLVGSLGIVGAAVASLTLSFFAWSLNASYFSNYLCMNRKFVKNLAEISASGVIMLGVALLFFFFAKSRGVAFYLGACVSAVSYLLCLFLFKVFEREELEELPLVGMRLKKRTGEN